MNSQTREVVTLAQLWTVLVPNSLEVEVLALVAPKKVRFHDDPVAKTGNVRSSALEPTHQVAVQRKSRSHLLAVGAVVEMAGAVQLVLYYNERGSYIVVEPSAAYPNCVIADGWTEAHEQSNGFHVQIEPCDDPVVASMALAVPSFSGLDH